MSTSSNCRREGRLQSLATRYRHKPKPGDWHAVYGEGNAPGGGHCQPKFRLISGFVTDRSLT